VRLYLIILFVCLGNTDWQIWWR